MSDKKEKFEVKSTLDRDLTVEYVEKILNGFKEGKIELSDNTSKTISLNPIEPYQLEIEIGKKEDKGRIKTEIAWDKTKGFANTDVVIDYLNSIISMLKKSALESNVEIKLSAKEDTEKEKGKIKLNLEV
ncbi:MAG: amphi-Trp domain-containing protein [Methanosarcinales archaeon]